MKPPLGGRTLSVLLFATAGLIVVLSAGSTRLDPVDPEVDRTSRNAHRPAVIVMIGDGLGRGPLAAASYYQAGVPRALNVYRLPHRGTLTTVGPDGVTDSAAAATAMATGRFTSNGHIGQSQTGMPFPNLVDLAHQRGMAVGVVTTSELAHATPGAFTAHTDSRDNQLEMADQLVLHARPEIMLGGGSAYFLPAGNRSHRMDRGLLAPLRLAGYRVLTTAGELDAVGSLDCPGIIGLFAPGHLPYESDHRWSRFPSLEEMSMAAVRFLERDPEGFFLMVEGARIDMAGHTNDLPRMIGETLAFDRAVGAVARWASSRPSAQLIVTADHDTGGLQIVGTRGPGRYPFVDWTTTEHTNEPVDIFGLGPGTEVLHDAVRDHRWVHALASSHIESGRLRTPDPRSPAVLAALERAE